MFLTFKLSKKTQLEDKNVRQVEDCPNFNRGKSMFSRGNYPFKSAKVKFCTMSKKKYFECVGH